MSNSFALPTLTAMKSIDTTHFTEFQTRCSNNLFEHLKIHRMIIDMFDSEEIRDDFLSTFSLYMAYKCVVRRLDPQTRGFVNEVIFMLPSSDMHLTLTNLENVFYCRRSTSITTFMFVCTSFVEFNIRQNGIFTELWTPIPVGFFESVGNPDNDSFALRLGSEIRVERLVNDRQLTEANNMFEHYRADLIERHFAQNKCNRIQILPERFEITKENAEEMNSCLLCCTYMSNYICNDCKYPMCKDCLKRLLKSTGECPGCRRKDTSFVVRIVDRSEEFNILVDDLNGDVEEHQAPALNADGQPFTLEQINEEVYAEQHPPRNSSNSNIHLHHDDSEDSDNDDSDDDEVIDPVIEDNHDDDNRDNFRFNREAAENELDRISQILTTLIPGVVFARHVIDPRHTRRRVGPAVSIVRNPTRRVDDVNRELALNLIFGQDDEHAEEQTAVDRVRVARAVVRQPPQRGTINRRTSFDDTEEQASDEDRTTDDEADPDYVPPRHEEEDQGSDSEYVPSDEEEDDD